MSERLLREVKRTADLALKKQAQEGFAKIFIELSCKGVAREIRAGRNVTGNVEFGIRHCVHPKLGPRVDPDTLKFTPMPEKAKEIEKGFVEFSNKLLENASFPKLRSNLIEELRQGDKAFEQEIRERRLKTIYRTARRTRKKK